MTYFYTKQYSKKKKIVNVAFQQNDWTNNSTFVKVFSFSEPINWENQNWQNTEIVKNRIVGGGALCIPASVYRIKARFRWNVTNLGLRMKKSGYLKNEYSKCNGYRQYKMDDCRDISIDYFLHFEFIFINSIETEQ